MGSAAVCCHCRFAQVQAKVAHKHDSWVREFLVKFASLVASHMQPLSLSLREARKELDSVSLAASKSGGVVDLSEEGSGGSNGPLRMRIDMSSSARRAPYGASADYEAKTPHVDAGGTAP